MPSPKSGSASARTISRIRSGRKLKHSTLSRGADPALLADRGRPDELVGLAALVGGARGRWPVRRVVLGASVHEQVVGVLGALPAPVAVHRPVAPDDGGDAADAGAAAPLLERGQVPLARGRGGVAAVGEAVQHQIADLQARRRARSARAGGRSRSGRRRPTPSRARWTRSLALSASRRTGLFASAPSATALSISVSVCGHDGPGAERQMPDLGVPHLAVGQPDARAAGLQRRVRIVRPQSVEAGLARPVDRVARAGGRDSPPVQHDQAGAA